MLAKARRLGIVAGSFGACAVAVVTFVGVASADPVAPQPPLPAPASPQAAGHPAPAPAGLGSVAPAAAATPATPTSTITPATSETIAEFFKAKGVGMEPQKAAGFKALNIVLPMPQGWTQIPDPNVPDAFAVVADRVGGDGLYSSNAALAVYKLVGDFDAKDAISHGFIDSQQQPIWRATAGSLADFGGMPSSIIEGTYRQNNTTLCAARRHVIATAGADRYLVTLTVTTSAQVSVAAGTATDAILRGYRVSAPGAAPPPAPAPAPSPSPLPSNQLLGLPR